MATRAQMKAAKKQKALTILSRCREADVRCPEWVRAAVFGQLTKRPARKKAA